MRQGSCEEFDTVVGAIFRYPFANEFLWIFSQDYYLGMKKFDELRDVYSSARLLLWDAYKSNSEYIKIGITQPEAILWMKIVYWRSAILWLNHCEDYMLQAIWLTLGLHKSPKNSRKWHKATLAELGLYRRVIFALQRQDSTILLPQVKKYREESRKIRAWANKLKHNEILEVKEFANMTKPGIIDFQLIKKGCKLSDGKIPVSPPMAAIVYGRKDVIPEEITLEEGLRTAFELSKKLEKYVSSVREGLFDESAYFQTNGNNAIIGRNINFEF